MNVFLVESLVACALIGASAGLLGTFLLIRRRALMGDVIGHSVLPGLCGGFIVAGFEQSSIWLYGGALLAALLAAALIEHLTRRATLKPDAAMAIVLTGFYAIGVSGLTWIQARGGGAYSGLESFLLGQAAAIPRSSLYMFAIFLVVLVGILFRYHKEFLAATFDPLFAETQGLKPHRFMALLSFLTACAVILSLPAVGLVLASALLILPAAIASLVSLSLVGRLTSSALIGASLGALGAWVSSRFTDMPTGPSLILTFTSAFALVALAKTLLSRSKAQRSSM